MMHFSYVQNIKFPKLGVSYCYNNKLDQKPNQPQNEKFN